MRFTRHEHVHRLCETSVLLATWHVERLDLGGESTEKDDLKSNNIS